MANNTPAGARKFLAWLYHKGIELHPDASVYKEYPDLSVTDQDYINHTMHAIKTIPGFDVYREVQIAECSHCPMDCSNKQTVLGE